MTSALLTGTVREVLLAEAGPLAATGLVLEVLRTTGTGAGTTVHAASLIREVLRSSSYNNFCVLAWDGKPLAIPAQALQTGHIL